MEREEVLRKVHAMEWYHAIEVAEGITTPGRYNPQPLLNTMGFPQDLQGKTVLDIGTYDGFFSFEAERRGAARVVAMDRHPAGHKGFALAHELLRSHVTYSVGSVYDLSPETHGTFDVVLFLGVLYHLRHPLLALDKIHSVCREFAFVESHVLDHAFIHEGQAIPLEHLHPLLTRAPLMQFYPGDELGQEPSNWWAPTVECLRRMLDTSGFHATLTGHWGSRAAFRASRLDFAAPFWY
jgi:tRNA (mo5U34)-methyltransferase